MPIVKGKTPDGLVNHAKKALKERWWYMWGTFGNLLTPALLNAKARQYPRYNGGQNRPIHAKHMGEIVCDCVGLIKGYCMWDEKKNLPVYSGDLDYNTTMMYNASNKKGHISTIPEKPGVCVYMRGHVGVYIGNGWVIECAGGRGAVKTPIRGANATKWTAWFECPFIDYNIVEPIKVGDTVRIKNGAKDFNGKKLAKWTYGFKFKVMQLNIERAVIGFAGFVTAAVNVKDLYKSK